MMKAKKLVDSKRIRARMIMLGLRNRDLAKAWGCAEQTASQKLNGTRPLSLEEANKLARLLKLSEVEYYVFYLNQKSRSAIKEARHATQ